MDNMVNLSLRIGEDLKEEVKEEAERQDMTFSDYIRRSLRQTLSLDQLGGVRTGNTSIDKDCAPEWLVNLSEKVKEGKFTHLEDAFIKLIRDLAHENRQLRKESNLILYEPVEEGNSE